MRAYILWESHEVNFRAELLSFDTLMVQRPTWSFNQKFHREFFVSRVWGAPSPIIPQRRHAARESRRILLVPASAARVAGLL